MGLRRVLRDLRLRRPAFDLQPDPDSPVWYRGRPFPLAKVPVDDELRARVRSWAAAGPPGLDPEVGQALAQELADAMQAPVACCGRVFRPAPLR